MQDSKDDNASLACDLDVEAKDILRFWFEELHPSDWFQSSPELDSEISRRFFLILQAAAACELAAWRESIDGRLAEIIVLDQFSRNVFRDDPRAYYQDPLALALAQEAVAADLHLELQGSRRAFLLMPYMHSESLIIHEVALELFAAPGMEGNLRSEKQHFELLQRFGRYPRRNKALGRSNTADEVVYLSNTSGHF
ncbi:MAG: DUF924 family protein [Pseudomonadales bacterium]